MAGNLGEIKTVVAGGIPVFGIITIADHSETSQIIKVINQQILLCWSSWFNGCSAFKNLKIHPDHTVVGTFDIAFTGSSDQVVQIVRLLWPENTTLSNFQTVGRWQNVIRTHRPTRSVGRRVNTGSTVCSTSGTGWNLEHFAVFSHVRVNQRRIQQLVDCGYAINFCSITFNRGSVFITHDDKTGVFSQCYVGVTVVVVQVSAGWIDVVGPETDLVEVALAVAVFIAIKYWRSRMRSQNVNGGAVNIDWQINVSLG